MTCHTVWIIMEIYGYSFVILFQESVYSQNINWNLIYLQFSWHQRVTEVETRSDAQEGNLDTVQMFYKQKLHEYEVPIVIFLF